MAWICTWPGSVHGLDLYMAWICTWPGSVHDLDLYMACHSVMSYLRFVFILVGVAESEDCFAAKVETDVKMMYFIINFKYLIQMGSYFLHTVYMASCDTGLHIVICYFNSLFVLFQLEECFVVVPCLG